MKWHKRGEIIFKIHEYIEIPEVENNLLTIKKSNCYRKKFVTAVLMFLCLGFLTLL